MTFLLYGANGYTGRLAAEHAVASGLRPVLAGRRPEAVRSLADRLALEWRAFDLGSPAALRQGLRGVAAVLHAAGPFSATAAPMVEACLGTGVHYLDITGEIAVFEAVALRDAEARSAGVMLLPGAGFDVVPTDCLAAHLKRRLPAASRLRLAIHVGGGISRGTAKTVAEAAGRHTLVRRGGRIVERATPPRAEVDFGEGPRPALARSWGDVATAWRSTGVPDIEVFFSLSPRLERVVRLQRSLRPLLATGWAQRLLRRQIERKVPAGPTPAQRARGRSVIVGEAWAPDGSRVSSRLVTAEAYTLTAWTAIELARRACSGQAVPGYQTPATAHGADFVLGFPGSARTDL
jgi:short subunit dehydrogenase-like uncharacterized protein